MSQVFFPGNTFSHLHDCNKTGLACMRSAVQHGQLRCSRCKEDSAVFDFPPAELCKLRMARRGEKLHCPGPSHPSCMDMTPQVGRSWLKSKEACMLQQS